MLSPVGLFQQLCRQNCAPSPLSPTTATAGMGPGPRPEVGCLLENPSHWAGAFGPCLVLLSEGVSSTRLLRPTCAVHAGAAVVLSPTAFLQPAGRRPISRRFHTRRHAKVIQDRLWSLLCCSLLALAVDTHQKNHMVSSLAFPFLSTCLTVSLVFSGN